MSESKAEKAKKLYNFAKEVLNNDSETLHYFKELEYNTKIEELLNEEENKER
jgi:hypothetical protein